MEIQQSSPNPTSINTLQSSIENLVTKWNRRQRCQLFFHCNNNNNNINNQYTQHKRKRAPWRTHLANFLESTPIHLLALSLLLLDLILTILDLSSSLLSSCSSSQEIKKKRDGDVVYHWGGIAILITLSTKTVVLAVALGRSFFGRPGRVVDGMVVIGALVLEMLVRGKGGGFLVVVSLWRVVRVVESAFELSDEAIEEEIEGILSQFEVVRDENQQLREGIVEKDERIRELEEALSRRGNEFLHGHNLIMTPPHVLKGKRHESF